MYLYHISFKQAGIVQDCLDSHLMELQSYLMGCISHQKYMLGL